MVKREYAEIELIVDEHAGEPVAQMTRVKEPDHLLCPITHDMFRDPVMVMESGHTYERKAIEEHLQNHGTDPLTRYRIRGAPVTNRNARNAVQAWLDENPGVTPDGWDKREMLSPRIDSGGGDECFLHVPDVVALCRWWESLPGLRREWAGSDPADWYGITWENGRVVSVDFFEHHNFLALEGPLPCLRGLTSLRSVTFMPHCLSGTIPENIFQGLPSLMTVWIHNSFQNPKLAGRIPEKLLQGLTRLREFSLSSNGLYGQIPQKLFDGLHLLKSAWLANNQLSGPIPDKLLHGLASLTNVHLEGNQLSGPIPEKLLHGLASLKEVHLEGNQLTGPIPDKLLHGLASLKEVHLEGNQLTGPIPEKLFEGLTSLQVVNLSGNRLKGSIPEKLFEGLTSLQKVDLSGNEVTGPIPEKLFEGLTSLQKVDLSGNEVTGPIPDRLRAVVKL